MARPIYETAKDRANEEEIALLLADRFKAKAIKAKRLYGLDGSSSEGYVGNGRDQVRNYASTAFKTYMISADKIVNQDAVHVSASRRFWHGLIPSATSTSLTRQTSRQSVVAETGVILRTSRCYSTTAWTGSSGYKKPRYCGVSFRSSWSASSL